MESQGTIGIIGRFRPLHNGGALLLETACKKAKEVIIGIGSANKYDLRNPFTPEETKEMIDAFLSKKYKNYKIIFIPDYGHLYGKDGGKLWRNHVVKTFGKLDCFITGNPYVRELLGKDYKMIDAKEFTSDNPFPHVRATLVRMAMAKKEDWEQYVPEEVAAYLKKQKLDERFRKEFGAATIKENESKDVTKQDSLEEERKHTLH